MNKDTKEWLREVATNRPALTEDEKQQIRELANAAGVTIRKTSCKDCYYDAAVEILSKTAKAEEPAPVSGRWAVRPGLDVIFRGKRVNADTITDDLAEWLLERGFPSYFLRDTKA